MLVPACDEPAPDEKMELGDREPVGKSDEILAGTCKLDDDYDLCGTRSQSECWCDDLCVEYGDCCADYKPICLGEAVATWTDGWTGSDAHYVSQHLGRDLGYNRGRELWYCHVVVPDATIECSHQYASYGWGTLGEYFLRTEILTDGSFDIALENSWMSGTVHPEMSVTLDRIKIANRSFDQPMESVRVEPACWVEGQTFPSGGWVEGYWTLECP